MVQTFIIFNEKQKVIVCLYTFWGYDAIFYLQLDLSSKLCVAVQLCQALTFMHTHAPPIAHLDIKPSNILVRLFNIILMVALLYPFILG